MFRTLTALLLLLAVCGCTSVEDSLAASARSWCRSQTNCSVTQP